MGEAAGWLGEEAANRGKRYVFFFGACQVGGGEVTAEKKENRERF